VYSSVRPIQSLMSKIKGNVVSIEIEARIVPWKFYGPNNTLK
jgi:hypothetical protein